MAVGQSSVVAADLSADVGDDPREGPAILARASQQRQCSAGKIGN